MKYELFEQAKAEVADAFRYYERDSPGSGLRLLEDFHKILERLRNFPMSAPLIGKRVRKAVLSHNPFNVIYYIHNETIFVVAFMHQKRKPGYWKKRLINKN